MGTPVKEQLKKWNLSPELVEITATSEKIIGYASTYYSAISSGIDAIKKIGELLGFFDTEDPMDQIKKQLDKIYEKLQIISDLLKKINDTILEAALWETKRDLETINGEIFSNMRAAKSYLEHVKKVGEENIDDQIKHHFFEAQKSSLDMISKMRQDSFWKLLSETYTRYEDQWSGEVVAKNKDSMSSSGDKDSTDEGNTDKHDSGTKWDYRLALPIYLNALVSRYMVYVASSKSYRAEYKKYMEQDIRFLFKNVYQRIRKSLITIKIPNYKHMKYIVSLMNDENFYYMYYPDPKKVKVDTHHRRIGQLGVDYLMEHNVPSGKWRLESYIYGAVEPFTGAFNIANYPKNEFDIVKNLFKAPEVTTKYLLNGYSWWWHKWKKVFDTYPIPEKFNHWNDQFRIKFFLRSEAKRRELYEKVGLYNLHNQLQQLYTAFDMKLPVELQIDYTGVGIKSTYRNYQKIINQAIHKKLPISLKNMAYELGHAKEIFGVSLDISMRKVFQMD